MLVVRLVVACAPALLGCGQILGLSEPHGAGGSDTPDGGGLPVDDGQSADGNALCVTLPSFGPATKYSASNSLEVIVGDTDHDGVLDLVANTGPDSATNRDWVVYKGLGNGTFAGARALGTGYFRVRIVDVDNDGYNDIVASLAGSVHIRRQNPAQPGTYLPDDSIGFPDPGFPEIEVGRLNGDALPDLVLRTTPTNGRVYFARAGAPGAYDVGPPVDGFVQVADIDGDGFGDLWSQTLTGVKISFNRAATPGVFDAPISVGPDSNGGFSAFGRLSGDDARLDFTLPTAGGARLYAQSGPRSFVEMPSATFAFGGGATYPTLIADINGDGRDDAFGDHYAVFQCPGGGPFYPSQPGQPHDLGRTGIRAFADLDNNGKPDAIALTGTFNNMTFNFIEVSLQ
jgi:hypothetical protein